MYQRALWTLKTLNLICINVMSAVQDLNTPLMVCGGVIPSNNFQWVSTSQQYNCQISAHHQLISVRKPRDISPAVAVGHYDLHSSFAKLRPFQPAPFYCVRSSYHRRRQSVSVRFADTSSSCDSIPGAALLLYLHIRCFVSSFGYRRAFRVRLGCVWSSELPSSARPANRGICCVYNYWQSIVRIRPSRCRSFVEVLTPDSVCGLVPGSSALRVVVGRRGNSSRPVIWSLRGPVGRRRLQNGSAVGSELSW